MTIWERFKIAWRAFARNGGLDLPDEGRSSIETLSGSMSAYLTAATVSPIIDFEMLAIIKNLWLYNPDVSQYVSNIVNLGNPGHKLSIDAASDATAEAAVNRLNESAARIYRAGVGVDGLINQYLTSIAWSGAVSSEDVVNLAAKRVEKVVLVPVEQIRFKYNAETDNYDPYQAATDLRATRGGRDRMLGLIKLNTETYAYYASTTVENSPYAKSPVTAAVETILQSQTPILENIRYMAQKFGLLGLVTASVVPPPRQPNEAEPEYILRSKTYLGRVRDALEGNLGKGLLVGYRDQKIEHTNVSSGAEGIYDINRISEEQVFSGLAAMPGFHGRTDATTETFADVVYYLLTAQVANMQRVVKRRQERTYRLDLRLAGIEVDAVRVDFNRAHSRNALVEAQTDDLRQRTVFDRVTSGLITPDEGAQELGYHAWADPLGLGSLGSGQLSAATEKRTLSLAFDKASQSYRYVPDRLRLAEQETHEPAKLLQFPSKKKGGAAASMRLSEERIDEILERFIQIYGRAIRGFADAALDDATRRLRAFLQEHEYDDFDTAEQFADLLLDEVEHAWGTGWASEKARHTIATTVHGIYEFYRLRDATPFGDSSPIRLRLGGPDKVSIEFIGRLDHFYFSKFANNTSDPLRRFFVERYFEDGAALFGRESTEELQDFRDAAGVKFKNLTDRQTKTIVQTAVQRVRNWAHIGTLDQAGFEMARVVATLDERTTELCRGLNGKLLRVGVAQKAIERLNKLEPGEFALDLYESEIGKAISRDPVNTINAFLEDDGKTISDTLVEMGRGFPPYHPNCRTRLEGYFEGTGL